MTNPDDPPEPLTTARLEAVRAVALAYLRECADSPPLSDAEQMLALAGAGVMPTRVHSKFGGTDQARLAWVVASCCLLRLERPNNSRHAASSLYVLLDELETFSPAAWVETYAAIGQLLDDSSAEPDI